MRSLRLAETTNGKTNGQNECDGESSEKIQDKYIIQVENEEFIAWQYNYSVIMWFIMDGILNKYNYRLVPL